jgi:hypothetical protein
MISPMFLARISWVPYQEGGRRFPPNGTEYTAPARFGISIDDVNAPSWSLRVELGDNEQHIGESISRVHFLLEDAPHQELHQSKVFALYEGRRKVAAGVIVDDPTLLGNDELYC